MKTIKKTASIICSLIIMIALGGYIFVKNFDLNRYKSYIEDIVLRETGRELKLNGDAKIGISLVPTVEISDVTFSNPEWASTPYMARFENLEVKFAIMPLLHKRVEVDKLILTGPEIYLETSVQGKNNWEFDTIAHNSGAAMQTTGNYSGQGQVKDASAALAIGLVAKEVELKRGVVSYYNAKTKQETRIDIDSFGLEIDGNDQPMEMSLVAEYDKQPVEVTAEITSISSILAEEKASFNATINAMKTRSSLIGSVEDLMGNIRYAVEGNIYNPAGNFGAPETTAELRVDGDMNRADIDVKGLTIATNLVTGKISADWSKAKPIIKANLSSGVFDLRRLAKTSMLSNLDISLISQAQALEVVPNDKVPYQYLKEVDASVNTRISKLIIDNDTVLTNVNLAAVLQNGVLNVSQLNLNIGSGTVAAKMTVNALKQQVNLTANGKNIKVQDLETDFATGKDGGIKILSGGEMDFDLNVVTHGATMRGLSENLDGQFAAVLGKSQMKTGKLDWLTNNIFTQLFEVLKIDTNKVTNMDITCGVIRADFKNGMATFPNSVVFDSSELKLISNGTLNLKNDKLNFTVAPTMNKLASGNIAQALAGFVKMGGTISNPKVKLDTSSALTTVVGAVMTSGASLGADVLLSGNDSPCYTALKGTKYATRFPKPTGVKAETKDVYNDTMQQTKEAVKEIGDAAKGLLKGFKNQLKGN